LLRGLEIDHELERLWLLDGEVSRLHSLEKFPAHHEVTYNYLTSEYSMRSRSWFKCRCGSKNCYRINQRVQASHERSEVELEAAADAVSAGGLEKGDRAKGSDVVTTSH
jgi:hypothetical protein